MSDKTGKPNLTNKSSVADGVAPAHEKVVPSDLDDTLKVANRDEAGINEDGSEAPEPDLYQHEAPLHLKTSIAYYEQPLLSSERDSSHRIDVMGDHWSIPWSDLMMVMFVMFAVLVTAQTSNKEIPEPEINAVDQLPSTQQQTVTQQPDFEPLMRINVFEKSQQAVRETKIQNVEIVLLDDQSVKVSVQGELFFDLGADKLKPEVRTFLDSLSGVIRQTPYQVDVIGHTDDRPINNNRFASNWELSVMRAAKVARHLITSGQIQPSRFTVMGRSKYEPAQPNSNDLSRSKNRRVEIIITRNQTKEMEDIL